MATISPGSLGQAAAFKNAWTVEQLQDVLDRVESEFTLDEAVVGVLPEGTQVLSVRKHGDSMWTTTACVSTIQPDGTPKIYFLKCAREESGGVMLLGEYTSVVEISKTCPGLLPSAIAWGKFTSQNTYFYLSEFVDMDVTKPPDPLDFTDKLARLHKSSLSPTGKFGFHVTTCDGKMAHTVEWEDSWAVFFAKLLRGVAKLDTETNGPLAKLDAAIENTVNHVIPRLLGVLQADGRTLKPSLIHGDLWEGNVSTRLETGEVLLFDAGSYYAHNEMDLGIWRCALGNHFRDEIYTTSYRSNFDASEPSEEFDDRNRLYSLKYNLNYSAGHPGSETRQSAYNDMCYLSEKYAPMEGLDPYDPANDPFVTGARFGAHGKPSL